MKLNCLHMMAILSFVGVSAQTGDSINIPTNTLYNATLDKIWENPIQYSKFKVKDFTETELSITIKDLNLKRTQTAEKSNTYEFKTQGIFNISENLRLLGGFDYQFIVEKELGYNLTSERTENQFVMNPHYIFAPKKANWESQKYNVMGGLSYNYSNVDFGAVINYKNNNSFRKSDPRPYINSADYSGKAFLGYHYKNHQISIFAGLGRKTDSYDVDFVFDQNNAPSNEDYFIRFSDGYGRLIFFNSYSNFGYKTINRNAGAGYAYRGEKNLFTINYSYSKSMETLFSKSADGYTYFEESLEKMKYRVKNYQTDANYWHKGNAIEYFGNLNFQSITGDNYSLTELGQNYRMTLDCLALNQSLLWKDNSRTVLGVGLQAVYSDFSARDLLGITDKYVKSLDLNLTVNKDLLKNDKQRVNVALGAKSYFPLSESLEYNPASTTSIFSDNVIKNDYYYDKTSKLGPHIGVQFFQKVASKTDLKIFTNFATLFPINSVMEENVSYNGNPNMIFNAGISLYY